MKEEPVSREDLLNEFYSKNSVYSYISRAVGITILAIGLYLIATPLIKLVEIAPLANFLLSKSFDFGLFGVTTIAAISFYFFLSSFAWLMTRPLYAFILMTIPVMGAYMMFYYDFNAVAEAAANGNVVAPGVTVPVAA